MGLLQGLKYLVLFQILYCFKKLDYEDVDDNNVVVL